MQARSVLAGWARRPWLVVAAVGLIAGLAFTLLTPPLAGYDEPYHFLRAYQVAGAQPIATHQGKQLGGRMPKQLSGDLGRLLAQGVFSPHDRLKFLDRLGDQPARGPKTFVAFPSSAVYSPVPYAPAALLMAIGRAFGASTLLLMYLGRFGSLLGTVALLALATARIPRRKWMFAAVALLPVTLLQASTLSADGVTIALALLVLALALDLAATAPGAVTKPRLVEVAIATVALGLAKPPYILFALAFAIPWRRHGGSVARALLATVVAGFAATAAWAAYSASVYVKPLPYAGLTGGGRFAPYTHVNPSRQERHMLEHPFGFARIIGRTVSGSWSTLLHDVFAQVPLVKAPAWIAVVGIVIVVVATVIPAEAANGLLRPANRALLVAIALVTFVALMALAYAGWNAVGSPRVEAFQGRYLLPLVPLLLVTLPARRRSDDDGGSRSIDTVVASASTLLLVATAFWLRSKFY